MVTDTVTNIVARKRIAAARSDMILDEPFFGALALRLKLVEDYNAIEPLSNSPSAWVDGVHFGYHPDFVMSLSADELVGLVKHEVLHCSNGHPWRRGAREHVKFNMACDYAINPIVMESGGKLPDGSLYEEEYVGKSAEWIYDRLPEPQPQQQQGGGQSQQSQQGSGNSQPSDSKGSQGQAPQTRGPNGQKQQGSQKGAGGAQSNSQQNGQAGKRSPQNGHGSIGQQPQQPQQQGSGQPQQRYNSPLGEVRDAPTATSDGEAPPTEEDWRQATIQAAVLAKGQGMLPAGMERFIEKITKPRIDWRSAMRRFAQEVAKADYSWKRPNPRYVASGAYLPALYSHEVGIIAIAVDTSGSVDEVLLSQFEAEVKAIADELHPRAIKVLYCDAEVNREETFERGDNVKLRPCGGGGTDFRPVFDAISKWDEQPVCIGYLTDLYGTFPASDPGIPTLWVTPEHDDDRKPPFGERVVAA